MIIAPRQRKYSEGELRRRGNFVDRALRLRRLVDDLPITRSFPLMYEIKLPTPLVQMLQLSTELFILSSLNATRKKKVFVLGPNIMRRTNRALMNLPNRTPNGVMYPKRENYLEYNQFCRVLIEIVKNFQLERQVEALHFPMVPRLVEGSNRAQIHKRPYASTKVHTDIWNGDPLGLLPIFIPLLGDIKRTTMEFWEPREIEMRDYFRVLGDYDMGEGLVRNSSKYAINLRHGYMYITDPLILHRTVKKGGSWRASVELRIVPRVKLPDDGIEHYPTMHERFISIEDFYQHSTNRLVIAEETFRETTERFKASSNGAPQKPVFGRDFKSVELFEQAETELDRACQSESYVLRTAQQPAVSS